MAQSKKTLRVEQYRAILEKDGIRYEDCQVLAFVFDTLRQPEHFHYDLMAQKPVYFVFDCWGNNANVVVPKDDKNAAKIIAIAANLGGQKTIPNLI